MVVDNMELLFGCKSSCKACIPANASSSWRIVLKSDLDRLLANVLRRPVCLLFRGMSAADGWTSSLLVLCKDVVVIVGFSCTKSVVML